MRELTTRLSRRQFAGATMGTIISSIASLANAQSLVRRETADLIAGPFYPRIQPRDHDADLTMIEGHRSRATGQIVHLAGRVMNVKGEPVRDATIEVWQANAKGRYSHPSDPNLRAALDPEFQGYARLRTDKRGQYRLTTIKPGAYPTARGDMRAPHIHFLIDGVTDRKVTQLFFPDEELNSQDRHLKSVRRPETLIARVQSAPGAAELHVEWDIVLTTG